MYSIDKNIKNEIIINKSKFITFLFKIDTKKAINDVINNVKQEYKDATHYCYAYIIDGYMKCSDDGEPSKTAGAPLLNVLEKNKLDHILVIVVRYFGGIKLGAGGLVRAYTKSITECLNNSNIIELNRGYLIEIKFNHSNIKQINFILKNMEIKKIYDELIIYTFCVKDNELDNIKSNLKNYIIEFNVLKTIYI